MTTRVAFAYHFNDGDWLGGKNYFASLFRAIRAIASADLEWVFVTGEKTSTSLPQEFPWLEVVRTPILDRLHPRWLARQFTLRTLDTDPLLSRLLRSHAVDVLSHSGYLGHDTGIKTLPWLYDFQFMHLPEYWEPKHVRWAEQRYRASCKYADALIVSSNDALRDLRTFAPECKTPMCVLQFVSNPVDFDRLPSKPEILRKYDLPEDYFYLPNQFWTNKNHRLALDALGVLKREGVHCTIACTGKTLDGRKPDYFDQLMAHCRNAGLADSFRVLGVVPYTDLQGLMAHASAVINPSRFEGWSTTVEEAKTFQRRLLLSDIPVHREQSPDLGHFFDVSDANALARLLTECLSEAPRPVSQPVIEADYARRLQSFGATYVRLIRDTAASKS